MPNRPRLALIAAVARNRVIGRGGELVWRESADQKHFRHVTMGCPVIMGRKTWDSLPARFRPLPGRRNIVVTRNVGWHGEGAERAGSLAEALRLAQDAAKVFVIGGAELHAVIRDASGAVLTEVSHRGYNHSLDDLVGPPTTWTEAHRSIIRFADKVADAYVAQSGR